MGQAQQKSSDELAQIRTELAIERSVMAANRTLMGWIRTALAMIGFGFTIYKVLQAAISENLLPAKSGTFSMVDAKTPMRVGLFLIVLGTVSILLGTVEYVHTMKHLDKLTQRKYKPWNFSTVAGYAVGLLGLFLSISIIINRDLF